MSGDSHSPEGTVSVDAQEDSTASPAKAIGKGGKASGGYSSSGGGKGKSGLTYKEKKELERQNLEAKLSGEAGFAGQDLTPAQQRIIEEADTEPAGAGEYVDFSPQRGYFACRKCGKPIYSWKAKFTCGCGWAAFDKCFSGSIRCKPEDDGTGRIEIQCGGCVGHLGHVFFEPGKHKNSRSDQRHCTNSASIKYVMHDPPQAADLVEDVLDLSCLPKASAGQGALPPPAAALAEPRGPLRRVLIDYDSTLNPGQGNHPLTEERVAVLRPFLERLRKANVEVFVLTASNPEKKTAALESAGLLALFDGVLSSTLPTKFANKGEYIASRVAKDGWLPHEQLLADDSIDAIQSVWSKQIETGEPRPTGAVAHTLRLPQHSRVGLTESDLKLIERIVAGAHNVSGTATSHRFSGVTDDGRLFVDERDTWMKCMWDGMPQASREETLRSNPPERLREWVEGRPDLAETAGHSELAKPMTESELVEAAEAVRVKADKDKADAAAAASAKKAEALEKRKASEQASNARKGKGFCADGGKATGQKGKGSVGKGGKTPAEKGTDLSAQDVPGSCDKGKGPATKAGKVDGGKGKSKTYKEQKEFEVRAMEDAISAEEGFAGRPLSAKEERVMEECGTEDAKTGEYLNFLPQRGYFACRRCGNAVYSFRAKFVCGCGWAAFDKCLEGSLKCFSEDDGSGRTEIKCSKCLGHFGHVFIEPGQHPTSRSDQRHCANSASLQYVKYDLPDGTRPEVDLEIPPAQGQPLAGVAESHPTHAFAPPPRAAGGSASNSRS
eukprot:TRINITY_DN69977_c0_g1_i1.p1 TRINITY_DN69977_c0_g1~~TRINITY_DN69977_c0_g1_i1.p1  ORF type:complete len:782 (+),score=152.46 TRINITY_DN69977_c0_g1_i1:99-2444(+)